jgi:parallel beta-helix repeat protein
MLLSSTIMAATSNIQKETSNTFEFSTKNTIYVDDNNTQGPWDGSYEHPYQYINDGILQATDGDTVSVFSGFYKEIVILNKSINFQGQQQNTTIINGQNNGSVMTITSDNVYIKELTIQNSGGFQDNAGITVIADNATITKCTIYRTHTGISVQNKSGTIITNCRFHTNGYGILSSSSESIAIDQCSFYHNGIGVYLYETQYITITNSYADTNGIGFLCERSSNIHISDSAARDNDDNEGGIFFVRCSEINIIDCNIVHNGVGINLINSSHCYIDRCNFSLNTHFSCKLKESVSSIIVTNCIFTKNLRYGLYAEDSAFTISGSNFFKNKDYGLYAKSSIINASYNWWGSKSGPAHTGLTKADRGTWNPHKITYAPWRSSPIFDIGSNWAIDEKFQELPYSNPWPEQITFTDLDTDGDGAPDWWEIKWGYNPVVWNDHQHLDPDKDSLNNIEECAMDQFDSNPFKQDVYLEFDWTKSIIVNTTNKPPEQEITQMIDAFALHNITLHVDTGNLGGGEELPPRSFVSYADIIDLYWDYFLHNDLNNPRQCIFHYGIICDYSEGPGFAVIAWDHLNSFIIGAQFLTEKYPHYQRERIVMTSAMHELGHTFGLIVTKYNGIDNHFTMKPIYNEFWIYIRYKSLMNYLYTFALMDFSDGSHGRGDFNDWGNLDFSFFKNTNFKYPL